jgi:hypothetical protein
MNRRLAAFSILAALALGLLLVRMDTADAFNDPYMNDFKSNYGIAIGSKLDSCLVCHISTTGGSRNDYGSAFASAGHSFTAALAAADSDRDGASNGAEIAAGYFPGDPSDTPPTAPAPTTTAPAPTTAAPPAPAPLTPIVAAPTTPDATVDFPMEYQVGDAGTVMIDLVDGKLVATVVANDGWTFDIESKGDEVEVEFRNGKTEIEFEAELEDGELQIESESDDDHGDDDDDADHRDGDHDDDDDGDDDGEHHGGDHKEGDGDHGDDRGGDDHGDDGDD